jgi:hypothetical protein
MAYYPLVKKRHK